MAIMYTPRTPRAKKPLLAVAMLVTALNHGKSQDLTLKPLMVYESSLKDYYQQQLDVQKLEYQETSKKKWWYYVPNVGLGLTYPIAEQTIDGNRQLTATPRLAPNINLGTGVVAQIDKDNVTRKARLKAIEANTLFTYRSELQQIRVLYRSIEMDRNALDDAPVTARMESNIFQISSEANRQQKITPLEFQQAQLTYQRQTLAHDEKLKAYLNRILELEKLARYNFPTEDLK